MTALVRTPSAKVLFLVPYPLRTAPSQRFRVESFLPELTASGISYRIEPFFDQGTGRILYKEGYFFLKLLGLCKGFIKRWWVLIFILPFYDYVFIHREAAPVGPPVFEWIIAKFFRKKVIYDFDDAIWIPNTSAANHFANWFKAFWKVKRICGWAYKVVGGNDYLCNYAKQFNKNVVKIPTCIDTEKYHPRPTPFSAAELVVGWTGSHSTIKYLDQIVPVIDEVQKTFDFKFTIIADKKPLLTLKKWQFIPWNIDTEIEDLMKLDIGVMPLVPDAWSEGKCGFKLIQYLALGIPAVASPVGVNKTIIEQDCNGYLCKSGEEWIAALSELVKDEQKRIEWGKRGREKVLKEFSIQSNIENFLSLFS